MTPIDGVLAALVEPSRRSVLTKLAAHGTATATLLASELPITRQAVVQHLAVLDEAGLVSGERRGRERWFSVRTAPITDVARWLEGLAAEWDRRLRAIKQIAEES